jgi:hypothetical protein
MKTTQERLDIKRNELKVAKGKVLRAIIKANIKVLETNLRVKGKYE